MMAKQTMSARAIFREQDERELTRLSHLEPPLMECLCPATYRRGRAEIDRCCGEREVRNPLSLDGPMITTTRLPASECTGMYYVMIIW